MAVTTLFWDVGGVILTNGWDRSDRLKAAEKFHLDWEDFQDRHELASPAFETGQADLTQYLERTIFYRARPFTQREFAAFMFEQSQEIPETRAFVESLARTGKYLLATINNESRELNAYRIRTFGLERHFKAFFSYVGVRKPDAGIYRVALEVTQRNPKECIFVDDRALNLECARRLGMATIQFQNAAQLRSELAAHGITADGN